MSENCEQRLKDNQKIILKGKNEHKRFLSIFHYMVSKWNKKSWFLVKIVLLRIHFTKKRKDIGLIK